MRNDAGEIVAEMAGIDGVAMATRGYPKSLERLPCVSVSEVSNVPWDVRDDAEYATLLAYDVHIFAVTAAETDAIGAEANARMTRLGYARVACFEAFSDECRERVLRFERVCGRG